MGVAASSVAEFCESFGSGSGHPKRIEINSKSYKLKRIIGEGGYAFVYLAADAAGRSFAIKRFVIHEPELRERFLDETRLHCGLCPHPNIVTVLGSEVKQRSNAALPEVWMVMEYCGGQSAQALVNTRKLLNQALTDEEIYAVIDAVVQALGHMHSQSPPVAHWDVKLDNVLFCPDESVFKLCDFGSASTVVYRCSTPQDITIAEVELGLRMTLLYRAPETLDLWKKHEVGVKADVWSLGVLIYILVYMEMPFEENGLEILSGVPKLYRTLGPAEHPAGVGRHRALMDIVRNGMLQTNPQDRMDIFSAGEALSSITKRTAPERPRPGLQSAPRQRFS
jgi:serine/threonine protein kinase